MSSFTGSKTITVSNTTFNGNPALDFTTTFKLIYQAGQDSTTNHDIMSQDAQGLHELSSTMSGGPLNVTSDTYTQPATIGINTVASGKTTFSDGSFVNTSIHIIGKERVTVPAGTFDCWKANYIWSDSRGDTETDVLYIDPALGFPVQSVIFATNGQGSNIVDSFTLKLQTTTVAPAIAGGSSVNFRNISAFAPALVPNQDSSLRTD